MTTKVPRPFEAALREAEARLERDLAQVQLAKANLERDLVRLKNAEDDAERYRLLIERGVVARQQYEKIRADADALEATVRADRDGVENAEASVRADRAAVENTKVQLGYCSIRSPMDGRTGSLLVQQGTIVKAEDIQLVVIHQITPIYVTVSVPEQFLSEIKKYMASGKLSVEASVPMNEERFERGIITFIDVVNTRDGTAERLTMLDDYGEYNPSWSPDGKKIVHDVTNADFHALYITDVKNHESTPLSGADGGNDADWSPNGKWIVFDRSPYGDPSLYILPPTGGTPTLVMNTATNGDWSPDGQRLVFQYDNGIVTANIKGGDVKQIVEAGYSPVWSPNGMWIAYDLDGDIYKVRVNKNGARIGDPIQLTSGPASDGGATWSQDSKQIAFASDINGDHDIWQISAEGGSPVRRDRQVLEGLIRLFNGFFGHLNTVRLRTINDAGMLAADLFQSCVLLLLPMLLPLLLAGLAGNLLQIGFEIHAEPLAPKLSKLNPITGVKRIVSLRGLVELVKSLLMIVFVAAIAGSVMYGYLSEFPTLVRRDLGEIWAFTHSAPFRLIFYTCLAMIVLAVLDYTYQRWQHEQSLKMTKQEVKDERKQTEGDPQIKARIRSLQRQAAYHRMIAEVPKADVVITNPTQGG